VLFTIWLADFRGKPGRLEPPQTAFRGYLVTATANADRISMIPPNPTSRRANRRQKPPRKGPATAGFGDGWHGSYR
jgi:hypothetical protein